VTVVRGGAALCTAAERWACVPRVLYGLRGMAARPEPCDSCGRRRLHRQDCNVLDRFVTLIGRPNPEKPRQA